ncbi:MAG TPA: M50 family metallopeptidase [Acidimicrobiales bacterium]|nr:M50 family metallopeptidase [Acidimicrobiales bacterium]
MSRLAAPGVAGPPEGPAPSETPTRSGPGEVARLLVVVAAVIGLGYLAGYGETVLLILFLIGCIVAHEFGHFIAAKTGRVKVTEFFVGFGPRLWSVRRGETEYGVKGLPLGGYCRIIGMNNLEEVDLSEETRTYRAAPLWRRLLIDVAGSSMHFVIALVVMFAMFFWTGDQGNYLTKLPPTSPIATILPLQNVQSPAEKAGMQVGDRIEAIDGVRFSTYDQMASFIQDHAGQRLDLTVDRQGRLVHLYPTPVPGDSVKLANGQSPPIGKKGFLGFSVSGTIPSSFSASVSEAGGAFVSVGARTFDALGNLVTLHGVSSYFDMLSSQHAAKNNPQQLTTVVALPSVLHQASQNGLSTVLWVLAVINISIGILNLLPFFPLDGGRVVVALYEGVRSIRRPYRVDMHKLLPVMYTTLILFVLYCAGWILINLRTLSS